MVGVFKRLAVIDEDEEDDDVESDEDWRLGKDSDTEEDIDFEEESIKDRLSRAHELAANSHKGRFFGLQKIGMKKILEHVSFDKQTAVERAMTTLLLASLPKSLPCRDIEMLEITAFIKGAISDDKCLGRFLYIHGSPGTGKLAAPENIYRVIYEALSGQKG
ncbi:hypothetical protein M0R45_016388 [Rubus argutus]|uniref:Origin recognition complex subunit 1 n=1 Tax=Rubus argutus TaxID=59490 RepID=A0AAW1XSY1_RUBAR